MLPKIFLKLGLTSVQKTCIRCRIPTTNIAISWIEEREDSALIKFEWVCIPCHEERSIDLEIEE